MNFELSDEQRQLADSVTRFLNERYDFDTRKKIMGSDSGVHEDIWGQLAELGVLSIPFSEDAGGFGGGAIDLMSTMQAVGSSLVVEPLLATVLAGRMVDKVGGAVQKKGILGHVMNGSMRLAFAHGEESARYVLSNVGTTATRQGDAWVLNGLKRVVLGAPQAARLVVSARTESGISLFIVDTQSAGVLMTPYRTVDNQRAADVKLLNVQVDANALLGTEGAALPVIEEAIDFATTLLCAEAIGAMQFANDTTLDYLKTRKQFGVAIGSFQALQHRMVDMFVTLEQARSMCYLACSKMDAEIDPAERSRIVSAAKIKIAEACRQISQESVQLHGGIGMTEELKVSHTFRRLTMIAQQYGDTDYHLERFAALDC